MSVSNPTRPAEKREKRRGLPKERTGYRSCTDVTGGPKQQGHSIASFPPQVVWQGPRRLVRALPGTAAMLATGFQETDIVMIFKADKTLKTALSALAIATAAAAAPSLANAQSAAPAAGGEPLGWYKTLSLIHI